MIEDFNVEITGLNELKRAVNRNPQKVLQEGRNFISRGLSVYRKRIINNPWRVGGTGGGSPVSNDHRYPRRYQRLRSGNLRDSHRTTIHGLRGSIGPDQQVAPYAKFVHGGTRFMKQRPWLDYVQRRGENEIERLFRAMLREIVKDLAR